MANSLTRDEGLSNFGIADGAMSIINRILSNNEIKVED